MPLPAYTEPHHDGSPLYLPGPPRHLGDQFEVLLRVPHASGISTVVARQVHDGEPFGVAMSVVREDPDAAWWRAELTQRNPVLSYRFLTDGGPYGYRWITAAGPVDHDPTDATDFRTSLDPGGPAWLHGSVLYQIFPDRFAKSDRVAHGAPEWAIPADWEDLPIWQGPGTGVHFFGGDLYGVAEKLPYLRELGVTTIYLTPVFPAPSNHRYNASSFTHVDPLLGGDEALAELTHRAHDEGLRVIGDFTTNHTGSSHEWFRTAQMDRGSEEFGYYYFGDNAGEYEGWFGDSRLPKVDHANVALRERMIRSQESPIRRFLRAPFNLDGWRIDVANMTGRHRENTMTMEVAREVRAAATAERADAYVVAEHFHDYRDDLWHDGWQGVMNYAGFTRPMWSWLGANDLTNWQGLGRPWPSLPGTEVVAAMRQYTAIPWQHLMASMTLLASHDTARIATIVGDPARVAVAVAALMAYPGVPMVWAGDEIGVEGVTGEDSRRAFPWHAPETWRQDTHAAYRELIAVRRGSPALSGGSLRWIYADDDRIAFLREHPDQVVLVLLARASGAPISLPSAAIGVQQAHASDTLYGSTPLVADGDHLVLPTNGPAAHMWSWDTRQPQQGGSNGQSGA